MSIINKLASSLGHRDEEPNIELAVRITEECDVTAVSELIDNLSSKNKNVQNDCIKVLYEIGERNPILLKEYMNVFLGLLDSKNNRLQWGAMAALNCLTSEMPNEIYEVISKIIDSADKGTVITKDNAVNILIKLCSVEKYSKKAFGMLIEQLEKSPSNQLPMYAERSLPIIKEENRQQFISTLSSRLDDFEKESKRKRVEKVIKKLAN